MTTVTKNGKRRSKSEIGFPRNLERVSPAMTNVTNERQMPNDTDSVGQTENFLNIHQIGEQIDKKYQSNSPDQRRVTTYSKTLHDKIVKTYQVTINNVTVTREINMQSAKHQKPQMPQLLQKQALYITII